MSKTITYKPFGEKAILIEWEATISVDVLAHILAFQKKIQHSIANKVEDCIIGYHSLTVVYRDYIHFASEEKVLHNIYLEKFTRLKNDNHTWQIPVCYDLQFGIDLQELSATLKRSIKEIIDLHSQPLYTVYFIGFLPGFLYLGGLDTDLHVPRKANPRLTVAKGSVGIGGRQTGVYPQQSAGGWNIIGKTPVSFFNIKNKQPCFAKPGDKIQFIPIDLNEYQLINTQIEQENFQIAKSK